MNFSLFIVFIAFIGLLYWYLNKYFIKPNETKDAVKEKLDDDADIDDKKLKKQKENVEKFTE